MPHRAKEFYYFDKGRADRKLHAPILKDGDHEAAKAVSRAVMKRLGFSDERIAAFIKPGEKK